MVKQDIRTQQSGLASFVILMVIIVILTLVTVSFSLLSRRELRQTLDRQLSTQAYYAAESGVNDATAAIRAGFAETKSQCEPYNTPPGNVPPPLNAGDLTGATSSQLESDLIQYTCLLIDSSPDTLSFGNVKTDGPTIIPLRPAANISRLFISWEDVSGSSNFSASANHDFPALSAWTTTGAAGGDPLTGVLRTMVMPTNGGLDRTTLTNNSRTYFLYPLDNASGGNDLINFSDASQDGGIFDGKCQVGKELNCQVSIEISLTGAPGIAPQAYLALTSFYYPSRVIIYAEDSAGNKIDLQGVQKSVDSTGRANDIVRRIQVRIPVDDQYDSVLGAIQSMDSLCKRLLTDPFGTTESDPGNCPSL